MKQKLTDDEFNYIANMAKKTLDEVEKELKELTDMHEIMRKVIKNES